VDELRRTDPEFYELIRREEQYQLDSIRLIPSENYVSRAVLEATGSILTKVPAIKEDTSSPCARYRR